MDWPEDFAVAEGGYLNAFWVEGDEFGVYTYGYACVGVFSGGVEGVIDCAVWFGCRCHGRSGTQWAIQAGGVEGGFPCGGDGVARGFYLVD